MSQESETGDAQAGRPRAATKARPPPAPRVPCEAHARLCRRRGAPSWRPRGGRHATRPRRRPSRLALVSPDLGRCVEGRLPASLPFSVPGCARGPCTPSPDRGTRGGRPDPTLPLRAVKLLCQTRPAIRTRRSTPRACGRHAGHRSSVSLDTSTCQTEPDASGLAPQDEQQEPRRPPVRGRRAGTLGCCSARLPWTCRGDSGPQTQTPAAAHQQATRDAAGPGRPPLRSPSPGRASSVGFHCSESKSVFFLSLFCRCLVGMTAMVAKSETRCSLSQNQSVSRSPEASSSRRAHARFPSTVPAAFPANHEPRRTAMATVAICWSLGVLSRGPCNIPPCGDITVSSFPTLTRRGSASPRPGWRLTAVACVLCPSAQKQDLWVL